MSTIDTRVVELKFDNAQFEKGVQSTLQALDKLNQGLKLDGATKGLTDVGTAASRFSLANIASGVDTIASKFTAMSAVAITALANITNRAVDAGLALAKSLTIAPISQGFTEYEDGLKAFQTILANTKTAGATVGDVNKTLAELNVYANKTIYSFGDMTKAIGLFTAQGVNLKDSVTGIKGIFNLVSLTGGDAEKANSAIYQLSQAVASGTVKAQDWISVVNAGIGGTDFQNQLKQTARTHGIAVDEMIKKEGSFKDSLKDGWLTSKVLLETLSQYTGDMSAQQLKSMGYSEKQIKQIQSLGATANDSATKLKSYTQLLDTLRSNVVTGWATSFKTIIGNLDEASKLWTTVGDVIGGSMQASADARNQMLKDWAALGGRAALIDALSLAFQALAAVFKPIKEAFRDIFPAMTGKTLMELTVAFHVFTEGLLISHKTALKLKLIFQGVFAALDIGWMIIKKVAGVIGDLFGAATKGTGGFLDFAVKIANWVTALRYALKYGQGLNQFFDGLTKVLKVPITILKELALWVVKAFSGMGNVGGAELTQLQNRFAPLGKLGDLLSSVWGHLEGIFRGVLSAFAPLAQMVGDFFHNLGQEIQNGVGKIDYSTVLDSINTGLFAGLTLLIKKFLDNGLSLNFNANVGGGVISKIKEAFGGLTDTMQAMQAKLKADTLLRIAGAIGILTLSVVALSMIDSEALGRALAALTVMFVQLGASLAGFQKVTNGLGAVKFATTALGLIALAIAVDILASAVKKLSGLDWTGLAKGLGGVTVLLLSIAATTKLMDSDSKRMVATGAGLILVATGVRILVGAVTQLAGLDMGALAKGLGGVAAILVSLGLFSKLANMGGIGQGAGVLLLAIGIKILAEAVASFGQLSWEQIGKGLAAMAGGLLLMAASLNVIPPSSLLSAAAVFVVASSLSMIGDAIGKMGGFQWDQIGKGLASLAGALVLIAGALGLLPPSSLLSAAAIFVVASSLGMIATALGTMGSMSWEEIAKGLVMLAGSLAIITLAMLAMEGALPGAAALLVVAASLSVLSPVLQAFGQMSWEEMGKGLLMLAGVFVVLGVAGALLTPVVPTLLGLGLAITLLGVGMLAAGAGVLAFSVGLTALAAAGAAGTAAIVGIVSGLIGLIPSVMAAIGAGLVAFAKVIAVSGPAITQAITTVLLSLLNAIVRLTPAIGATMQVMLNTLLNILVNSIPRMVSAGMQIITGVLNGIARNIGGMVTAASNVIVNFINGVSANLPRIIQSGVNLVVSFVNGVANAIRNNSSAMGDAGGNLAAAIIQGMVNGINHGIGSVVSAAKNMAGAALDAAMQHLGIKSPSREFFKIGQFVNQGFVNGLNSNKSGVTAAFDSLKKQLQDAMYTSQKTVDSLEAKLTKLTHARHKDIAAIKSTRAALAQARSEHAKESAAYSTLMKNTVNEKKLQSLATQYDSYTQKIKDANSRLADAIKVRDDYNKSVKDQYANLPDASKDTKLPDYVKSLEQQIVDTQKFAIVLQQLRKLGLNDQMYKELVAKGTDALPFAQQILDGGKISVDQINTLDSDLNKAAAGIANTASSALYQAAVDSAAGFVKGLQAQQKAIDAQMEKIAASMVNAIKKKLGIKSPSRVFAEIGKFSNEGLAQGLSQYSNVVSNASESVGHEAINSLRKSISGMSDLVNGNVDINPTIRPVLDLSEVEKNAGQIGSLLTAQPVQVGAAYASAKDVAAAYSAIQAAQASQAAAAGDSTSNVTYNQYNNSPKALSNAEIYRQSKNLISTTKGALGK